MYIFLRAQSLVAPMLVLNVWPLCKVLIMIIDNRVFIRMKNSTMVCIT